MYPNLDYFMNSRGRKKFYINYVDLVKWAYNITQATQEGDDYHDAYSRVQSMFNKITPIFNGSKTYYDPQRLHKKDWNPGETHPPEITYPEIIPITDTTFILNYYLDYYSERLLEQPVEPGKFNLLTGTQMDYNAAMYFVLNKICHMIDKFTVLNQEKYLRRLALLNLQYNPIDNYDGNEYEHTDYDGEEVFEREAQYPTGITALKITGPTTNAAINQALTGSFDNNYKKNSAVAQVGDTRNGRVATGASVVEESGTTTASTTTSEATNPKTSHYTTTYDNAEQNRLESYNVNEGDVATTQNSVSSEDVPTMIEAYQGSPSVVSYKDTTNYDGRDDNRDLQKWGNMGTTMTQDMMTKEKEVLDNCWGVLVDFMEELNSYIFLGVYNF